MFNFIKIFLSFTKSGNSPSIVTRTISYASIVSNTALKYGCILLDSADSSQSIYTCNMINNEQTLNNSAMIYTSAQLFINSSCILGNNKGKRLFQEYCSNCQVVLTNCTIDDDVTTSSRYSGSFTIESTIKNSFINALTHIVTNQCDSFLDSYEFIIVTTSTKQPKRTKNCVLSCIHKRPMIDALKSIE